VRAFGLLMADIAARLEPRAAGCDAGAALAALAARCAAAGAGGRPAFKEVLLELQQMALTNEVYA
jgi:hypothetical protein